MIHRPNAKTLNRISNIAVIAAAVYVVAILFSRFASDDERVGAPAAEFTALSAAHDMKRLPLRGESNILVFWATWCAPCTFELGRLQAAIDEGELPADRVFAVSIGEEPDLVFKHAREKKYSFQVLVDEAGVSGRSYQVQATPTTVHIDASATIRWVAVGAHPLSVSKAKSFLRPN